MTVGTGASPAWPARRADPPTLSSAASRSLDRSEARDRALIEAQPVCIASSVWSAGELGDSLVYHYRRDADCIEVGYFAFWSTERPWGKNALTLTLLPAAAIDAVYSHFLFVFPGVRDMLYGPGDVEGATVRYRVTNDNRLLVLGGIAQNETHDEIELAPEDLRDGSGRVILLSEAWSHQLGAKHAAQYVAHAGLQPRCFLGASLTRLARSVITEFRLGSPESPARARPAWRPFQLARR